MLMVQKAHDQVSSSVCTQKSLEGCAFVGRGTIRALFEAVEVVSPHHQVFVLGQHAEALHQLVAHHDHARVDGVADQAGRQTLVQHAQAFVADQPLQRLRVRGAVHLQRTRSQQQANRGTNSHPLAEQTRYNQLFAQKWIPLTVCHVTGQA